MSSAPSTSVKEIMNRQQHRQQEQQASENTMKGEETKTSPSKKKIWSLKKLKNNKKVKSLQAVLTSSPFRWKTVKVMGIHHSFVDNVVFKVVSVCEGVVLVSTVCFFFLCCGCHV